MCGMCNRSPVACVDMGWLRLVGFLISQVSFAEYRLFYRALLQKRPIILRSLLIEATPYLRQHVFTHVARTSRHMCGSEVCAPVSRVDI